jgi:hypothetical protein
MPAYTFLVISVHVQIQHCLSDCLSFICELVEILILLFVEEIVDTIISATYAFYLENRQVY